VCAVEGVICACVSVIQGVFFSVLVGRYGCRVVTLSGAVVWFIGFACSSLAPNVIVLCLTYGIVAGLFYSAVLPHPHVIC